MIQSQSLNLRCEKDDHKDYIDMFCFNQFCTESRLNCFKCIQKGIHQAHLNDVQKFNYLLKFIENKNKECDDLIDDLNQFVESVNQSFSQFKTGIKNKYSLSNDRLLNLNQQQINDVLNSIIKQTDDKQLITTLISEQTKKLNHSFNYLYEQLQLSSINYYQILENNRKLSKELYERGHKLYKVDKYKEAIEIFDKSIQLDPNNHLSLQFKGECLKQLDQYEYAITCLDKALAIDPKHVDSLCIKGECLKQLNPYKNAIIWLDKALAIDPKHVDSLSIKGECLRLLNQYENAITCFDKALTIDPKHVDSLSIKGECLRLLMKFDESLKYLNQALQIDQRHINSLRCKGACLQDQYKYNEALNYYYKSLKQEPNDQWTKIKQVFMTFRIRFLQKEIER